MSDTIIEITEVNETTTIQIGGNDTGTQTQGPQGEPGADGQDGADGAPGAVGPQGEPGADGQDGADGVPGAVGPQGEPGADGQDGADGTAASGNGTKIVTRAEYEALSPEAQNDGTLYFEVSGDGTLLLLNASGSTFAETTAPAIVETYTTENLDVSDSANDGGVFIYPDDTAFVKTVRKTGDGTSKLFAKVKTGYVTVSGADIIKIGNGNINLPKSSAVGVLCRFDTDQLTGLTGSVELLRTRQTDQNNIVRFSMGFGGSNDPETRKRNNAYCARAGLRNNVAAEMVEKIGQASGWATNNNANVDFLVAAKNQWVWLWAIMKDEDDEVSDYRTMTYNEGSTNFQPNNSISPLGKLHGNDTGLGSAYWRRDFNALYGLTGGTGITSEFINNVDFEIATAGASVDIARVIILPRFSTAKELMLLSHGAHPEQLGIEAALCLDFGALPAIAAITAGAPVFDADAADSPLAFSYGGTNLADNPISFNNKAIV